MGRTTLLCSSSPISSPPTSLRNPPSLIIPFRNQLSCSVSIPSHVRYPLTRLLTHRRAFSPVHSSATQEVIETNEIASGFVEIGFILGVHGIQGEVCVKPNTGFPELRFRKAGQRWLRQQVSGTETIQEVELVEGREHPGRNGWILRFRGVDTVDQARQLVGSTLLVKEDDRPLLEEDEFYTRDLVGMRLILKETGELVGTVADVFNTGASDLLHVMLESSVFMPDESGKSDLTETGAAGPLVWIPFVEAIVPNVDLIRREMEITPPKGLLQLNVRPDMRSKKERRQLEWKERKKFQKRLIAAKKKLCEMEQQHVFHGFRFGEKSQRSLLADQIVEVNSKLLQQALQNVEVASNRWSITESISGIKQVKSRLRVPENCLTPPTSEEKLGANFNFQEQASHLASNGKVCIVLDVGYCKGQERRCDPHLVNTESIKDSTLSSLETLLSEDERLVKVEYRESVPLVLVCPDDELKDVEKLLSSSDYFGFDCQKVWFLQEEKLPIVSSSEEHSHKILMKSPWEMLQSPVGSGGVISLLSSHNMIENLSQMGLEYIQICSIKNRYIGGSSLLLGFAHSQKADVGVQIPQDTTDLEESFGMVFSMNFMKKLARQINKLQFYAIPTLSSHVEMVEKKWVDVLPSSPNSYELCCTIYSCINACSPDKICTMEITG
ncbi:hypothetical protein SLE2022_305250 [Rubroshorea leprosula]